MDYFDCIMNEMGLREEEARTAIRETIASIKKLNRRLYERKVLKTDFFIREKIKVPLIGAKNYKSATGKAWRQLLFNIFYKYPEVPIKSKEIKRGKIVDQCLVLTKIGNETWDKAVKADYRKINKFARDNKLVPLYLFGSNDIAKVEIEYLKRDGALVYNLSGTLKFIKEKTGIDLERLYEEIE